MGRTSKYWFDNEKKVMKQLGLKPTPASGSGPIFKEDGYNDYILCQLKSTEKESYAIKKLDIEKLLYNSDVTHKIPLFVIQFMDGPMLIATVPSELGNISKFLNEGLFTKETVEVFEPPKQKIKRTIKSAKTDFDKIRECVKEELEVEIEEDKTITNVFEERRKRKEREEKKRCRK